MKTFQNYKWLSRVKFNSVFSERCERVIKHDKLMTQCHQDFSFDATQHNTTRSDPSFSTVDDHGADSCNFHK